jgi:hypothetical protein
MASAKVVLPLPECPTKAMFRILVVSKDIVRAKQLAVRKQEVSFFLKAVLSALVFRTGAEKPALKSK